MLYHCVFKKLPFRLDEGEGKTVASTVYGVSTLLKSEELELPCDSSVSELLRDLIQKILRKDPAERPPFEEVLKHPWFEGAQVVDETNMQNNISWASDDGSLHEEDELDV
jgi:serine/threonine protein kinase